MARTLLSVLTEEIRLESLLISTINQINYSTGYVGSNEQTFMAFLKNHNLANHILFVKPTITYQSAYNVTDLRSIAKIDIIIIAPPLAKSQIGIVQLSNISGYIIEQDINPNVFLDIINQLYWKGYFANNQILEIFWINSPKTKQIIPKPKFTDREAEVLYWMCHNYSYQQIAEIIKTGASNVRNKVAGLKTKTFSNTVIALVALSIESKWVTIDYDKFNGHSPFLRNIT